MSRMRLGEMLIQLNALTPHELEDALKAQKVYGGKLGTNLVELGFVDEALLASVLAMQSGLPSVLDGELREIPPEVLALVPKEVAARLVVVPFRADDKSVHVALSNPRDLTCIDEIRFATNRVVKPYVAAELSIRAALHEGYGIERTQRYIRLSDDPMHQRTRARREAKDAGRNGTAVEEADEKPLLPEHHGPIGLEDVISALQRSSGPEIVPQVVVRYLETRFNKVMLLALRAEGYRAIAVHGSGEFRSGMEDLCEAPGALHKLLRDGDHYYGPLPWGLTMGERMESLGVPASESVLIVATDVDGRHDLMIVAASPLEGEVSPLLLRQARMLMEKVGISVKLHHLTQRLSVLPSELSA